MTEDQAAPGQTVRIDAVSDGQHHLAMGDGEAYFVGKDAVVKSVEPGKIWVEPDGLGYVLWFRPADLSAKETL